MRRLLRSGHGCDTTDASNSGAVGGGIVEPQRRTTTKRPMEGVSDEEPASKHSKADGRLSEGSSLALFITLFITLFTISCFQFYSYQFQT
jgi:hypothetical protein